METKPPFNPDHCRPFSLLDAKEGAPYCQRIGMSARIGIWDASGGNYPLVGVIHDVMHGEVPCSWTKEGKSRADNVYASDSDLVMLPVGFCQDKPVHVGDVLIEAHHGEVCIKWIHQRGLNFEFDRHYYTWPRTEPEMPKCSIPDQDIGKILHSASGTARQLVDAAISHALTHQREEIAEYLIACGVVSPLVEDKPRPRIEPLKQFSPDVLRDALYRMVCTGKSSILLNGTNYFRADIESELSYRGEIPF